MLPTEAAAAMAADQSLGLALERRSRRTDRPGPGPAGLDFIGRIEHARSTDVDAWLVRRDGKPAGKAPRSRIRLLDRFYVPDDGDEALTTVLFDLVADLYEETADMRINRKTARALLREVIKGADPAPLVLDYGCGTGVAASALRQIERRADLIGVDLSLAMLARAAASGEPVMNIADWRLRPPRVAGAIACFVLHYGVSDADLLRIAECLLPGGTFAANYFKATAQQVERLTMLLASAGLQSVRRAEIDGTRSTNLLLSYRKQQ